MHRLLETPCIYLDWATKEQTSHTMSLSFFQVAAVFVKSIAVIYNGYAVAASLWEVELAFCTVHTLSFR